MRRSRRKMLGVVGLGVNWAIVWGVLFTTLVAAIGLARPQDLRPGEGPFQAGATGALAGFISGFIFGLIVTFAEDHKPVTGLLVPRVAFWGFLASAVWPALNRLPVDMLLALCLLGGMYAAVSAAVARRYEARRTRPSLLFTIAGRSVRDPLRSACAPAAVLEHGTEGLR